MLLILACRFTPAIGATAFVMLGLITLVLWRGGTIEKISIPSLFEVKLQPPIEFRGIRWVLYLSLGAVVIGLALAIVQLTQGCERCDGMPGETAWVYAGQFDATKKTFQQGPYIQSADDNKSAESIAIGSWIKVLQARKAMILDYSKTGVKRAMDSPFSLDGKIDYSCRTLGSGQRLYVADRKMMGPSPTVQHLWFRVRLTPPGS